MRREESGTSRGPAEGVSLYKRQGDLQVLRELWCLFSIGWIKLCSRPVQRNNARSASRQSKESSRQEWTNNSDKLVFESRARGAVSQPTKSRMSRRERKHTHLSLVTSGDADAQEPALDRTRCQVIDDRVIRLGQDRVVVPGPLRDIRRMVQRTLFQLRRQTRRLHARKGRRGRELGRRSRIRRAVRVLRVKLVLDRVAFGFPLSPFDQVGRDLLRPLRVVLVDVEGDAATASATAALAWGESRILVVAAKRPEQARAELPSPVRRRRGRRDSRRSTVRARTRAGRATSRRGRRRQRRRRDGRLPDVGRQF